MKINFYGHSCIQISSGSNSIIIDPFIKDNPLSNVALESIKADYILLTHGHFDHIADALELAKNDNSIIIAVEELADYYGKLGVKTEIMHVGGGIDLGFCSIYLTYAQHSSSVRSSSGEIVYVGNPVGFIIKINGLTIYHAGDTGLFKDMELIGEQFSIDYAFLPIGGRFTMNPNDAVLASQLLKPKCVIPIHYNTFEPIVQDEKDFIKRLKAKEIQGKILYPDEVLNIQKRK